MKFDDLEIGKEYTRRNFDVVRVVDKAPGEVAFRIIDVGLAEPFGFHPAGTDFSDWRPYTPPPAPVVRYVFARLLRGRTEPGAGLWPDIGQAEADIYRVGPVIKVELPVDPDMLARVKGGAS